MERSAVAFDGLAGFHERGIFEEPSALDRLVDANEILHHNAPRAEVQVTDLAVPHLSLGKSDAKARGVQERARRARPEAIPRRRIGERNGVSFALFPVAPSVEHYEHDRT